MRGAPPMKSNVPRKYKVPPDGICVMSVARSCVLCVYISFLSLVRSYSRMRSEGLPCVAIQFVCV